jgi:hypothetical protein
VEFFLTGVAVVACLLVLAGFLIRQGVFGGPKNSRPLCRRCGYLLEGLSQPRVCPECGNDLTRRRAIRLGENRKRRRVLVCGVLVLALAGVAGHYTWQIGENAGWQWDRIKPMWLLRHEARATHAALPATAPLGWGANPALGEINRRMDRGDLSERQIRALVADALHIQADAQQRWDLGWRDRESERAHQAAASHATSKCRSAELTRGCSAIAYSRQSGGDLERYVRHGWPAAAVTLSCAPVHLCTCTERNPAGKLGLLGVGRRGSGSVSAHAEDFGSNSFDHSVRANAAVRAIAERQSLQRAPKPRRPSRSQRSVG